ncbi:hypothetical protein ACIQOU_29845 [Streptomyces sp. NPDC091279]|uniref:hypothetical protein n=1 Tax=unclassified Streptomyces TaxID=2593676 RepID=UPI00381D6716
MKDDPAAATCDRPTFWVDRGKAPDVPRAIDPKTLAVLADQETKVPDTEAELKPISLHPDPGSKIQSIKR